MLTVAVNELQNQLSGYLQYVKNGGNVLITERNKVIAEISARTEVEKESADVVTKSDAISEKFQQLYDKGEMILAKKNTAGAKIPVTKERLDWESVYNQVRADRV